ncbi:MAG: peptidoglycan-binding protein [Clostridia bacterium]|nr:peptidoglycan-binding protein [Clostridia bacterium]
MSENIQERNEEERKEKIRQLQRYLREIAKNDTRIPLLAIDGIFENKTEEAVTAFQTVYALPITNGEVDEQTWNRIYEEFIKLKGIELSCSCFDVLSNPDALLREGESGYAVYFLQVMLLRISDRYSNFPRVNVSGIIDEITLEALSEIKRVHNLNEDVSDAQVLAAINKVYCSVIQI